MTKKPVFIISFLILIFTGSVILVFAQNLDTTPPVISQIRPENIIGPGAQIKWNTDELSDSKIMYGTASGNYPYLADFRCDAGSMVSVHCVNLTNLLYSTVYYYKVKSSDAAGNTAISSENQFTSGANVDSGASAMPYPPFGLSALSAQPGYVALVWTDNSTNESEFKIWRRSSGASIWDFIVSLGINVTSFTETNVPLGSYEYRINACNSAGCSYDSNIAAVTVSGSTVAATSTAGAAPTIDLKINNIDGTASLTSPANYTLSWTTTGNPTSCSPGGTWSGSGDKSASSGTWQFNSVTVIGLKTYTLTCSNVYGSASDTVYADVVTSVSGSIPVSPSSLTGYYVSNGVYGPSVNLNWSDNSVDELEFKLYRRFQGGSWLLVATYGVNTASVQIAAIDTYNIYEYKVNACNSYGCSADSNSSFITNGGGNVGGSAATSTVTETVPSAPSNLFAVLASNGLDVNLSWADNSANESEFKIYNRVHGGVWSYLAMVGANHAAFSYYKHPPGSYEYRINACNSAGCSYDSNIAAVTVSGSTVATTTITTTVTLPVVAALLKGVILDAADFPVANANIHIFNKDFTANFSRMADIAGLFTVDAPAGDYYFEISPPFGRNDLARPAPAPLTLVAGEIRNITAKFSGFTKTITGAVRFFNGKPVMDAEVGAYNSNTGQSVKTIVDASGNFSLKAGAGKWTVAVHPLNSSAAQWRWTYDLNKEVFFGDNADSETKPIDFTVVSAGSVVIVKTVDEASNLISGAGVMLDTAGAIQSSPGVYMSPETQKADAAGQVKFLVSAGRYYLRAFLPNESGFINPQEQLVDIGAGEEKTLILIFRKPVLINSVLISGVVKLDDGRPVDAVVWAWSQSGRSVDARANLKGEYSILVPYNDRWSIGAGKEVDGFPYKSTQILVDVKDRPVAADLILTKLSDKPLPSSVAVQQAATQQIIAQATDGAKVTVPPQAAGSSGNITVEVTPTIEAPSQAASKVVGTVYDISIKDQAGKNITQLKEKMEIVLPYNESELKAQGVTEDKFIPSYFDETTGAWVKVDDYTVDKEKNLVILRVNHLTRFAIVAAADIIPPVGPANAAAVSGNAGEVIVSWTNPASDFHHVKIYRSTQKTVLGQLIFNDVVISQKKDIGLTVGSVYYYTVRAVDSAGNESTNTNQVSAIASASGTKISSFARNLKFGNQGDDVLLLQQTLIDQNVYPEKLVTGYFGSLTKAAVVRFQEKYSDEILKPLDLAKGTGFVGSATRAKLNKIISGQ